jgi:hypothetical protein
MMLQAHCVMDSRGGKGMEMPAAYVDAARQLWFDSPYLEHLLRLGTLPSGRDASNGCAEAWDDDRACKARKQNQWVL